MLEEGYGKELCLLLCMSDFLLKCRTSALQKMATVVYWRPGQLEDYSVLPSLDTLCGKTQSLAGRILVNDAIQYMLYTYYICTVHTVQLV